MTAPIEYIFAPAGIDGSDGLLGIVIRKASDQVGSNSIKFFTSKDCALQVGVMKREKGYIIPPHVHQSAVRTVSNVPETLLIQRGRILVNFYTSDQCYVGGRIVETGDVVVLLAGGHGFEILEDAEIYEVRQGPYLTDKDKVRFDDPNTRTIPT